MRFWTPAPGATDLHEWWLPLVRAARLALNEQIPWLIVIDEWALAGRVERRGRADVWIYVHHQGRGELNVDDTGQPYRFIANSRGPSPGRFKEIDIRTAVRRSGIPHVNEAVWFDPPHRSFAPYDDSGWYEDDEADVAVSRPALRLVT